MPFTRGQWLGALAAATAVHGLLALAVILLQAGGAEPRPRQRSVEVSLEAVGQVPSASLPAPELAESPAPPAPESAAAPASPAPAVAPDAPPEAADQPGPEASGPDADIPAPEAVTPEPAAPVEAPETVAAVTVSPEDTADQQAPQETVTAEQSGDTAAAAEAPEATGAQAPPPADSGEAGADDTAAYIARIRSWLARNKNYPPRARRLEMEGVARVHIVVDRDGRVLEYRLLESSGHELLDREVAAMIERAQPLPRMPTRLNRNRMELIVPIRFTLR